MNFEDQLDIIRKSTMLRRRWYRETYPDVVRDKIEPALHYLQTGAAQGHDPSRFFDTRFYTTRYPDVLDSGLNPLVHFETIGAPEGRLAHPDQLAALSTYLAKVRARRASLESDTVPPNSAGRDPAGRASVGLETLYSRINLEKKNNYLLFSAVQSANLAEIDRFSGVIDSIARVIADLGITWRTHPGLFRDPEQLPPAETRPVVVIAQGDSTDYHDSWSIDRVIALARAENPQAPLIFCIDMDRDLSQLRAYEADPRIDHAGFALADALAVADKAYTVAAMAGIDALIRDVPLTVLGAPVYAGWGFTDDRSPLPERPARLSFGQFFTILNLCGITLDQEIEEPADCALTWLRQIFAIYDRVLKSREETTTFPGLLDASRRHALKSSKTGTELALHLKSMAALMARSPDIAASRAWPVLLEPTTFRCATPTERSRMLADLIDADALGRIRSGSIRAVFGGLLVGLFKGTESLPDLLRYLEQRLDLPAYLCLVRDLQRLTGLPLAVLAPNVTNDLRAEIAALPGDDILEITLDLRRKNPKEAPTTLLDWARKSFDRCQLPAARRLLDFCLLCRVSDLDVLDMIAELYLQRFDFESAAELLALCSLMSPGWKAGRFDWRAANAHAVCGQLARALPFIAASALRNEANLQRLEILEDTIASRYPGIDAPLGLEACILDGGPNQNPVKLAKYLIRIRKPAEAEKVLTKADEKLRRTLGYLTEMTNALALQGRHAQAKTLIENRLKGSGLHETVLNQAMRISYFSGDAEWGLSKLRQAQENGISILVSLERQVLLAANCFEEAMQTERNHSAGRRLKPYLGTRHTPNYDEFVEGTGRTLLVALLNGPGDDVRAAAMFPKLLRACAGNHLQITCDPRLQNLFQRSFPEIEFIPCQRVRNGLPVAQDQNDLPETEVQKAFDATGWRAALKADRVALINDLLPVLVNSIDGFDSRPFLIPDPERVAYWQERLKGAPRPLIGLAWSSMLSNVMRDFDYLSLQDIKALLQTTDKQFINLQYYDCSRELAEIEIDYPGRILNFSDLDQMNEMDEVVALMACLDLVISPNSTPVLMSGAIGRPTIMINPAIANKYWGRFTRKQTDYWYGTVTYVNGAFPGDKAGLVERLSAGLAGMTDPKQLAYLDAVAACLDSPLPDAAAARRAEREWLLQADDLLFEPRLYRDTRYWTLRARLFERVDKPADAAECWMQACSQTPQPAPDLLRAHWQAQVRAGRPDLAEKFGPLDSALLKPEDHALHAHAARLQRSHHLAQEALTVLASGQRAVAAQKLRQLIRDTWDKAEYAPILEDIVERLTALPLPLPLRKDGRRVDLAQPDGALPPLDSHIAHARSRYSRSKQRLDPKPLSLFITGHPQAGAEAVTRFLQYSARVILPGQTGPAGQGRLPDVSRQKLFGPAHGLSCLMDASPSSLFLDHLGAFLLGPVLGVMGHDTARHELPQVPADSLRGLFGHAHQMPMLVGLCDQLLSDLEQGGPEPAASRMLSAVLKLCHDCAAQFTTPERDVLLWDRCLDPSLAGIIAGLDHALMIVVTRDPRDQYVDLVREEGGRQGVNSVAAFVARAQAQKRLRQHLQQIPYLADKILDVSLEDVVTDARTRAQILEFTGLADTEVAPEGILALEELQGGIGLYRNFADQQAMRDIARALPDMLWRG